MKKILVIDDDYDLLQLLKSYLEKNNYEVTTASSGGDGIRKLDKSFDLVICDVRLPDIGGLEIITKVKEKHPHISIIMITGYADVRTAVEALRIGASDYITKPLHPDELLNQINELMEKSNVSGFGKAAAEINTTSGKQSVNQQSTNVQNNISSQQYVEGESAVMQTINKHIELVAPTDMSVIIMGETGTGKEYVAKRIHDLSARRNAPFIALDCGALPHELAGSELFGHKKGSFTGAVQETTGHFEMANGGTLFLDEIGNLSYENQIKLLRVLQERKVKKIGDTKEKDIDIRLLVATNENLKHKIKNGEFREDLYHRLNEFGIEMPSLRQRGKDIQIFSNHFLTLANARLNKNVESISEKVEEAFAKYVWPGNLRELNNVIKRAVLLCNSEEIKKDNIPAEIFFGEQFLDDFEGEDEEVTSDLKSVTERAEKKAIIAALKKYQFNKTKVAKALNVDRKTLYNKINAYGIEI